ncbi:MAG: zinc-binding dehydrogenase [Gemmatimonadota bacterium]|nr:MAG: zinc-binding dehydrogenase [Gemmatimonadota bacterium]
MQAVVLREFGSPKNLVPENVPDPVAGPGEVLIRVEACGVCYHDVINRRGSLPRTSVPAILGHEAAGRVVEVGPGVDGWSVGDGAATLQRLHCGECRHCQAERKSLCREDARFFGEEIPGGYAAFMAAPIAGLGRVPADVDWPVAATACCTSGTAVHVVRTRGKVQSGETVLVTGASGGVGTQALQLARHDGAHVIAVTSSEQKAQTLYEVGAHEVIVSPDLSFSRVAREITGGQGVDVALEIVGSMTFEQSLRSLGPGGRLVVVGNLQTVPVQVNPGLLILKELEILGAYATTEAELREAFSLIQSGALRPAVSEVLPLPDAWRAHERLEQRGVTGRLVLAPG